MKQKIFLRPDSGRKIDSEVSLIESLRGDEQFILKHHPDVKKATWRIAALGDPDERLKQEQVVVWLYARLKRLLSAIEDPNTTVWKAVKLGMSYQDMVQIYRGPSDVSFRGRVNLKNKKIQNSPDELALKVTRRLRSKEGRTFKQAIRRLENAYLEEQKIAGVEIEKIMKKVWNRRSKKHQETDAWVFRKDNLESMSITTSTLQRHYWQKSDL